MPDTLFTQPPHWEWLIILYFFLGGIASGAYAIAVLVDFVGSSEDRGVARVGYFVAFPLGHRGRRAVVVGPGAAAALLAYVDRL